MLRCFKVALVGGTISDYLISEPVSFLSHFATPNRSDNMPWADGTGTFGWDMYIIGLTSSLVVEDRTFSFANQIGFVMGLFRDRKNKLMENDVNPITLTRDSLTITNLSGLTYYSVATPST